MEILIVGTGAMATLFAGRLSGAGHEVTMLGSWKHGVQALKANGARIIDEEGRERAYPVKAVDDPQACRGARQALVLVKAWQTERAARQLAMCLAADGLAVTLQNGLGNREKLSEALNNGTRNSRVALGVTTSGATLLGPGLTRIGGQGSIDIERHPAVQPMESALKSAGFETAVVADAEAQLWGKLVVNAAINPLTAILRVPNGELLRRGAAFELMGELAMETATVARAEHIKLPFNNPLEVVEGVARKTATNHSSMLQDVQRGAPTEIDAICGAVYQHGERLGISTPVNRLFWKLVRALAANSELAITESTIGVM